MDTDTVSAEPFLIEPRDLPAALGHCTLIDARTPEAYDRGHIPGAVFLTTYQCFVPDTSPAGMTRFADDLARRYGAVGVSHDRPVVVYEDETGMRAARELWLLQYLGHRSVRMVHGGLRGWMEIGGDVERTSVAPSPAAFAPGAPLSGFVPIAELLASSATGAGRRILDVRDATEFAGRDDTPCCERRGRIPGAVWLEWTELLENGRYKSPAAIRALLAERGVDPDTELVPYCHRGARSANTYFGLRHAGCTQVRNFIGSFHEWSAHPGAPVER